MSRLLYFTDIIYAIKILDTLSNKDAKGNYIYKKQNPHIIEFINMFKKGKDLAFMQKLLLII